MSAGRTILVVDDDELSRELLELVLSSEGYQVQTAVSGEAALAGFIGETPEVILTDMQMPGLSGDALGRKLREVFGANARLIAISGSEVAFADRQHFDGFLLKPFAVADLEAAIAGLTADNAQSESDVVLDQATYHRLCAAMSAQQVRAMFAFCLDDANKRLARMKVAVEQGDDALYRREAHTIKGGCGMLGSLELKAIAGAMESGGIALDNTENVTMRDRFVVASARLQRILDTHTN